MTEVNFNDYYPWKSAAMDECGNCFDLFDDGYSCDFQYISPFAIHNRQVAVKNGKDEPLLLYDIDPDSKLMNLGSVFGIQRIYAKPGKKNLQDIMYPTFTVPASCVIRFTNKDYTLVDQFARMAAKAKADDPWHKGDAAWEYRRERTGRLGELAVQRLIGMNFSDWNVGGDSRAYDGPDMLPAGFRVGVKAAEWPKTPLIPAYGPQMPQVFVSVSSDCSFAVVLGYASSHFMAACAEQKALGDETVIQQSVLDRGTKTGFVGQYGLWKFRDYKSFYEIVQREDPGAVVEPCKDIRFLYNEDLKEKVLEIIGENECWDPEWGSRLYDPYQDEEDPCLAAFRS